MRYLCFGACLLLAVIAIHSGILAQDARREIPPFEQARKLEREGKEKQAFLKYLTIPGAEHMAAKLARPKAKEYLDLLRKNKDSLISPLGKLVEGDLLLALDRKEKALDAYRKAASGMGEIPSDHLGGKTAMEYYYPVEPSSTMDYPYGAGNWQSEAMPFKLGPGSHRDNWLIRRFIALGAMDDAQNEFARVSDMYERRSEPYIYNMPILARDAKGKMASEKRLISPAKYDGKRLQFTLDYAYFLKRRELLDESLELLLQPFHHIDMDHDPNSRSIYTGKAIDDAEAAKYPERGESEVYSFWHYRSYSAGVSRKEYVRLAYGTYKLAGKEEQLVEALKQQIDSPADPKAGLRAMRLLARVRLHQGRSDEALKLELHYIEKAGFDEWTAAFRRGQIYDNLQENDKAIAEFEKVMSLEFKSPDLPDRDEEFYNDMYFSAKVSFHVGPESSRGELSLRMDVLSRLERLHAATGDNDKVLEVTLRKFSLDPGLARNLDVLEQTAKRFKTAGKYGQFEKWAAETRKNTDNPSVLANFAWMDGDYLAVVKHIGEMAAARKYYSSGFETWKERFRKKGENELRMLLKEILRFHPNHVQTKLELLELEGRFSGPEYIEALELLIDADRRHPRRPKRGDYNPILFRNTLDIAYRLMRLYEKTDQEEKLISLGMRIAKGEKPFEYYWRRKEHDERYRDENRWPEDLNGCLALLIQKADKQTLHELDKLWENKDDFPAKKQLKRRLAGGWKPIKTNPFGWANMPDGVTVLACNENVLSLASDTSHIYAGLPWGVAVYTHSGQPMTRIALGDAALDLAVMGDNLWVATPLGLYKIDVETWQLSHLALDGDLPESRRNERDAAYRTGAISVAVDGKDLWIGTRRNIQHFNTQTNVLRAFSKEELRLRYAGEWSKFIFDRDYVWAGGDRGWHRYDKKNDGWSTPEYNYRPIKLIGLVDEVLWGEVYLGDDLRARPCIVGRETLEITPIVIEGNLTRSERMINGPFIYFGKWDGKPVFGPGSASYYYDEDIGKLRPLPKGEHGTPVSYDKELLPGLRSGNIWRRSDGSMTCDNDITHYHRLLSSTYFQTGHWQVIALPDGALVLGAQRDRCPRYKYPGEDWPDFWETWDGEGGLFLISPDMNVRRFSSTPSPNALPGDMVLSFLPREQGTSWVGTNCGLAAINSSNEVLSHFSRSDGLCANRVTGATCLDGLYYFGTGWGDHGGGLAVYDPATTVFTSLVQSDGLCTDMIADIENEAGKLEIIYDVENGFDYNHRLFPPGEFDPKTSEFSPRTTPRIIGTDAEASRAGRELHGDRKTAEPMPYLGGAILSRKRHNGKMYLCGTRGMVIFDGGENFMSPIVKELHAEVIADPSLELIEQAKRIRFKIGSPDELTEHLMSPNPYIRARALASVFREIQRGDNGYTPIVLGSLDDPHPRVRTTCIGLLSRSQDPAVIEALEPLLADPDPAIRAVAATSMARLGKMPDLSYFKEIFESRYRYTYLGIGVNAQFSTNTDRIGTYRALVSHANREVFELMLQYPLPTDNYEPRQEILKELGISLSKKPEAGRALLSAYSPEQVRFASAVMGYAGKAILPELHEALKSKDRVVRSNAARGCGAIKDPSSIPHLIKALDLESGLSLASIVCALGELKADEAMPYMTDLYIDARNDEKRRQASGYRGAQSGDEMASHYVSLRNLDSISSDWDELKAAEPKPIDPRRNEDLLKPSHILEAVGKIGPMAAQEFYRAIAGEKEADARREAAIHLAEGGPDDMEKNLPILRSMVGDRDAYVRINSAVSLLIVNEDEKTIPILLEALQIDGTDLQLSAVKQLDRVEDPKKLLPFRKRLHEISRMPRGRYSDRPAKHLALKLLERLE